MPLLVKTPSAALLTAYDSGFADCVEGWGSAGASQWISQCTDLAATGAQPAGSESPEAGRTPYAPGAKLLHLPVDVLGLKVLAGGGGLDQASCTCCRMCTMQPDGTFLSCELPNTDGETPQQLASIVAGGLAAIAWQLMTTASQHVQAMHCGYELRILSIPGLYFEGLRLKNLDDSGDIVLAITPLGESITSGTVLTSTDFLNLARPAAAARLAASRPGSLTA